MLEAEIQAKVLSLYLNDKKSIRDIARIMGVDRKTVKRIIKRKQVILDRQRAARTSLLEPYREHIREMLIKDPTMAASTMLHRLREIGYMGGITILRDYVAAQKSKSPK